MQYSRIVIGFNCYMYTRKVNGNNTSTACARVLIAILLFGQGETFILLNVINVVARCIGF